MSSGGKGMYPSWRVDYWIDKIQLVIRNDRENWHQESQQRDTDEL